MAGSSCPVDGLADAIRTYGCRICPQFGVGGQRPICSGAKLFGQLAHKGWGTGLSGRGLLGADAHTYICAADGYPRATDGYTHSRTTDGYPHGRTAQICSHIADSHATDGQPDAHSRAIDWLDAFGQIRDGNAERH